MLLWSSRTLRLLKLGVLFKARMLVILPYILELLGLPFCCGSYFKLPKMKMTSISAMRLSRPMSLHLLVPGNSPFTSGLSVGMMYMMYSAGKAEISKLYNSMDETAKIVQELKAELSRRKTLQNKLGSTGAHADVTELSSQNVVALEIYGHPIKEGECSSRALTEDRQIDPLVMDQLEAELEQELEKLPLIHSMELWN